jgi:hypothetical protein
VCQAARVAVVDAAAVRRFEECAGDVGDVDLGERVADGERPEVQVPLVAGATDRGRSAGASRASTCAVLPALEAIHRGCQEARV